MGWQPGGGSGTGGQPAPGAWPRPPVPRTMTGCPGSRAAASGISARPALSLPPSWRRWPGPEWRCPGAEPDELIGVVRRLAALESWASAAKLAVVRELIRQDDLPALARPRHGDLPDQWSDSLNHELALALAVSVQSAEQTALTAWELGARLPGIAALHADGTLAYSKAKLIVETSSG